MAGGTQVGDPPREIPVEPPQPRGEVTLIGAFAYFLRHPDNLVFLLPALACLASIGILDPRPIHIAWYLAGWALFLPQEYFSHIFVLHFPARRARGSYAFYRLMYRLHYGHHDFPRRFDLMFIPLWLTLPLAVANMALFRWMTEDAFAFAALTAGLFSGYLLFEWTHLFCHLPYRPRTALGRAIRAHHGWHHHRNEKRWFAVSLPVHAFDPLFRTGGPMHEAEVTGSSRLLGMREEDEFVRRARVHFAPRSDGRLECSAMWMSSGKGGQP